MDEQVQRYLRRVQRVAIAGVDRMGHSDFANKYLPRLGLHPVHNERRRIRLTLNTPEVHFSWSASNEQSDEEVVAEVARYLDQRTQDSDKYIQIGVDVHGGLDGKIEVVPYERPDVPLAEFETVEDIKALIAGWIREAMMDDMEGICSDGAESVWRALQIPGPAPKLTTYQRTRTITGTAVDTVQAFDPESAAALFNRQDERNTEDQARYTKRNRPVRQHYQTIGPVEFGENTITEDTDSSPLARAARRRRALADLFDGTDSDEPSVEQFAEEFHQAEAESLAEGE